MYNIKSIYLQGIPNLFGNILFECCSFDQKSIKKILTLYTNISNET